MSKRKPRRVAKMRNGASIVFTGKGQPTFKGQPLPVFTWGSTAPLAGMVPAVPARKDHKSS